MDQNPKLFRTAMKIGVAIALGRIAHEIVYGGGNAFAGRLIKLMEANTPKQNDKNGMN